MVGRQWWWGGGVGIVGEKAWHRGRLEGWLGRRRTGGGELFRGGEAARGSAGGGWWLREVQVEDELQALPKLSHVKCLCYHCV